MATKNIGAMIIIIGKGVGGDDISREGRMLEGYEAIGCRVLVS
jgi:hypothetical protein